MKLFIVMGDVICLHDTIFDWQSADPCYRKWEDSVQELKVERLALKNM